MADTPSPLADRPIAQEDRRYCRSHRRWFSIKRGCDDCRKAGWCPYYGKGCPC